MMSLSRATVPSNAPIVMVVLPGPLDFAAEKNRDEIIVSLKVDNIIDYNELIKEFDMNEILRVNIMLMFPEEISRVILEARDELKVINKKHNELDVAATSKSKEDKKEKKHVGPKQLKKGHPSRSK